MTFIKADFTFPMKICGNVLGYNLAYWHSLNPVVDLLLFWKKRSVIV